MSDTLVKQTPHVGVVTRIEKSIAHVRFQRSKQCEHCGACMSLGDQEMELSVENTLNAEVGDRVRIELSPRRVVQASLIAYAIPLILLLLGVWLGSKMHDLVGLACGVGACALAFLILRALEKRGGLKDRFSPRMTAIESDREDAAQADML